MSSTMMNHEASDTYFARHVDLIMPLQSRIFCLDFNETFRGEKFTSVEL